MRVAVTIKPITYPEGQKETEWKNMFKPCATQRLFLPVRLYDDPMNSNNNFVLIFLCCNTKLKPMESFLKIFCLLFTHFPSICGNLNHAFQVLFPIKNTIMIYMW